MRFFDRENGFTLVESLTAIAIVAVLVSMTIGVGKHLKEQGNIKLTQSTIDILVTATELYYQDNNDRMPFETPDIDGDGFSTADEDFFENDFNAQLYYYHVAPAPPVYDPATFPDMILVDPGVVHGVDWSGEALYYFLCQSFNSKRIISTINAPQVTAKDDMAIANVMAIVNGAPQIDMPRFVDAWGNTIRYRYAAGDTFCVITSPGKDKKYGTPDDINSKK